LFFCFATFYFLYFFFYFFFLFRLWYLIYSSQALFVLCHSAMWFRGAFVFRFNRWCFLFFFQVFAVVRPPSYRNRPPNPSPCTPTPAHHSPTARPRRRPLRRPLRRLMITRAMARDLSPRTLHTLERPATRTVTAPAPRRNASAPPSADAVFRQALHVVGANITPPPDPEQHRLFIPAQNAMNELTPPPTPPPTPTRCLFCLVHGLGFFDIVPTQRRLFWAFYESYALGHWDDRIMMVLRPTSFTLSNHKPTSPPHNHTRQRT